MKKYFKVFSIAICCVMFAFFATACSFSLESLGISGGKSAYQIAVDNGFGGTEVEWLESLKASASTGKSAYELAVDNGFTGTEAEWLSSIGDSIANKLQSEETNIELTSNLALRSVVIVQYIKTLGGGGSSISSGAGTIVDYDKTSQLAYIITCYHVIADSGISPPYVGSNLYIKFYGTEDTTYKLTATFLGGSPYADIAVLSVKITSGVWEQFNLRVADVDTSNISIGRTVVAIGNSQGKGLNIVRGNVSRPVEESSVGSFTGESGNFKFRVIRFNAIIQHGNSGGALFDGQGKFVGVVNAKSSEPDETNFAYAIPASVAYGIYTNVRNQPSSNVGKICKKYHIGMELKVDANAGVELYTDENGDICLVQTVKSESNIAGIVKGDQILNATLMRGETEVKSIKITTVYDLGELMWYATQNDDLILRYEHSSENHYTTIHITDQITSLYNFRENLQYA